MKKLMLWFAFTLASGVLLTAQVVDVKKTKIKWTGKKVTGEHWGYVMVKTASLSVVGEELTKGSFVVDMNTLTNEDMEAGEWHDKLLGHLRSDDFFSVDKYPEAKLEIVKSAMFKDGKANVDAKLTIKGKTHPVNFVVNKLENGYHALITVDRTLYDIKYGSGKFFEGLGDKMIYDEFTLDVHLEVK